MAHFNGMKNTTYLLAPSILKKLFIEVDGQTSRLLHHSTVYFVRYFSHIFKFNFILVALNYATVLQILLYFDIILLITNLQVLLSEHNISESFPILYIYHIIK